MKKIALSIVLFSITNYAFAFKSCEELKTEIAAKLTAKNIVNYSLEIVANDQTLEGTVVGSCENATKKIVYLKK